MAAKYTHILRQLSWGLIIQPLDTQDISNTSEGHPYR
jgi:hypothetical protein